MDGFVLFATATAIGVLFYILKLDAPWIRIRVEMTLAMLGIDYRPSRSVCFVIAAIIFYIVYGVIFDRHL